MRLGTVLLLALVASACRKAGTCEQDAHCGRDQRCCAGLCKDIYSDVENCGNCGVACSTENAAPTCVSGQCQLACLPAFGNCNSDARDGCEAELSTSTSHCGGCGKACIIANASAACTLGACGVGLCSYGYANCDGQLGNGCEMDVRNTLAHCGTCNKLCAPANATGACRGGSCRVDTCKAGYGDCNTTPDDGCEVHTDSSLDHCGQCQRACNPGQVCVTGECRAREIIFYGGYPNLQASSPTDALFKFDLETKQFSALAATSDGGTPGARGGHAAVWDQPQKRMLLFGGMASGAADALVWALDFAETPPSWKVLATTGLGPAGRAFFAHGWDASARKWYVFGGQDDQGDSLGDFWVFDVAQATWTKLHDRNAAGAPSPRSAPAAAYDGTAKRLYLFGGFDDTGSELSDTWSFDTAAATPTWTLHSASGPSARAAGVMIPGPAPLVLHGGLSFGGGTIVSFGDAWTITGGASPTWTNLSTPSSPPARFYHAAVFSSGRRLIFGGADFSTSTTEYDDVWALDAVGADGGTGWTWTELRANRAPNPPPATVLPSVVARE